MSGDIRELKEEELESVSGGCDCGCGQVCAVPSPTSFQRLLAFIRGNL